MVVIGAGVAVVVVFVVVVGATRVVKVVSVLAVLEARVVTGDGVELITAVVLPDVGLVALLVVATELPLVVELATVGLTPVKLVGEIVIGPLLLGAVLLKIDKS